MDPLPSPDAERRLARLRLALAAAVAVGFALSWRLWTAASDFPPAPVSAALPHLPLALRLAWPVLLIALLASIAFSARPRRMIVAFVALAALLSLWDQNRWQPWFFQYVFLLAVLGALPAPTALPVCRLVVALTYLWSGLQKLNVDFARETWPDMSRALAGLLPEPARDVLSLLAVVAPLVEIGIGAGLLTRRLRRAAIGLALATHAVILAALVASGENLVVWPWNVAMALFVVLLFRHDDVTSASGILRPRNAIHAVALVLFGFLPALSWVDLWDSYLSAALYSGNTHQAVVYIPKALLDQLPADVRPHVWQRSEPFFLDVNRWSYAELGVPLYPEPRVYKRVADAVCRYAGRSSEVRLRILGRPAPLTGRRASAYFDCEHLD